MCEVCGKRRSTEGHHIVKQQNVRSLCRTLRIPYEPHRWDVRNRLGVCDPCHDGQTDASARISYEVIVRLRPEVLDFCEELDAMSRAAGGGSPLAVSLERDYPAATNHDQGGASA